MIDVFFRMHKTVWQTWANTVQKIYFFQVSFELIGIEMVHVGQVFDGSRDDLVTFMQKNGYKFQAKAGHDEFFAKDAQKWN